jgi:hypothetical protein
MGWVLLQSVCVVSEPVDVLLSRHVSSALAEARDQPNTRQNRLEAKGTDCPLRLSVRSAWVLAGRCAFQLGFACFIDTRRPRGEVRAAIEAKRRPHCPASEPRGPFAHTVHSR